MQWREKIREPLGGDVHEGAASREIWVCPPNLQVFLESAIPVAMEVGSHGEMSNASLQLLTPIMSFPLSSHFIPSFMFNW